MQGWRYRSKAAVIVTLGAGFALAACGGDDETGATDAPSSVAPADASVYVEVAVRPDDEDSAAIEEIAARFPGGEDLGETIVGALDRSFAEDNQGELTYEDDIEPWLGERAAVALSDPADFEDGTTPPVIVQTTDEDAARQFIEDGFASDEDPETDAEYAGVEYTVGSDGSALGVVEGFLVGAPDEERMNELIDIATGADESLADAGDFSSSADDSNSEEAIAFASLDPTGLIDLAIASEPRPEVTASQVVGIAENLGLDLERRIALTLGTEGDSVRLDTSVPTAEDGTSEAESAALLGSLPSDSIVAAACSICVDSVFEGFELGLTQAAAEDGVSAEEALKRVERQLGIDLPALRDAIGGLAFFARGGSVFDAGGAVVLEVTDSDPVADALRPLPFLIQNAGPGVSVERLRGLPGGGSGFSVTTPDLPTPLHVVLARDRLVVALGDDALEAVLDPGDTLADSGAIEKAESALGGDFTPTSLMDLGAIFDLVAPFAGSDPSFRQAQPYLEPFDEVVGGTAESGDALESRTVVTFD